MKFNSDREGMHTIKSLNAGDILADVRGYVLQDWWVDLFKDAMAESGRLRTEDLNPIFAYLILLDVLDLPSFFASIKKSSVDEGILNGEIEIDSHGERGLFRGEEYDVVVRLESVENKSGSALGQFQVVTLEAKITGRTSACDMLVRNRMLFLGPGDGGRSARKEGN